MEVDSLPPPQETLLFFKVRNLACPSCLDERSASVFKYLMNYSQSRITWWKIDLTSCKKTNKLLITTKRLFTAVSPAAPVLHEQSYSRLEVGHGVTWKNPSTFPSSMPLCSHSQIFTAFTHKLLLYSNPKTNSFLCSLKSLKSFVMQLETNRERCLLFLKGSVWES